MLAVRSTSVQQMHTKQKQEAPIAIIPPSERYFEQMAELDAICYLLEDRSEWATPDYYRSQLANFPEGQFIAVDTASDRVIGLTASMRVNFNPQQPLLESWYQTTNYG